MQKHFKKKKLVIKKIDQITIIKLTIIKCLAFLNRMIRRTNNRTNEIIHYLESSRTPIHKLNSPFCLDASNSGVHIFRYHVPTEQQATSHVLAVTWIAFHHLIGWLKACTRDLSDAQLLVVSFLGGDDRGVSSEREVNSRIWYQVSLKFKEKQSKVHDVFFSSACFLNVFYMSVFLNVCSKFLFSFKRHKSEIIFYFQFLFPYFSIPN